MAQQQTAARVSSNDPSINISLGVIQDRLAQLQSLFPPAGTYIVGAPLTAGGQPGKIIVSASGALSIQGAS